MEIDQIICGDCNVVMRKMKDEFIDLVITSPPYDRIRDYGNIGYEWSKEKWIYPKQL